MRSMMSASMRVCLEAANTKAILVQNLEDGNEMGLLNLTLPFVIKEIQKTARQFVQPSNQRN